MQSTKSNHQINVSARNFSLFRAIFGLLMIPQVLHLTPFIHELAKSTFVFHYPYLSFIEAYSHELIDALQGGAIIGAVLLAIGILPRVGAGLFLLCFGYLFLIDITFYNNHYYLWCLLAVLFMLADTHKSISITDLVKNKTDKLISINTYMVFGLMVSIVYFFAAVVKINGDWLQGYPMRLMVAARGYPSPDALGYLLSYGGLLFDAVMPFILWRKPKAWYVWVPYFAFHGSNYFIFNIGEFPLVMMGAWLLYLPLAQLNLATLKTAFKNLFQPNAIGITYAAFFVFNLLFPLRFLLVEGNVAWHRQGYYFSWRMMLNNHEPLNFQYNVVMPERNDSYAVRFDKLVTFRQYSNCFHDAYNIWSLAQKLKKDAQRKYKTDDVRVYCTALITLNQHPPRLLINDKVDLGKVEYHLYKENSFINKF